MQEPESTDPLSSSTSPDKDAEAAAAVAKLRRELAKLREKRGATKDRDIHAVLDMRIKQIEEVLPPLKPGEAEVPVPDSPKEEEVDSFDDVPPPDPVAAEQAERLIRQARLEKQRGNRNGATDLLRKAADVAPGSAVVLEALGDDLVERRMTKKAIAAYKRAHALDPKNVALETKFAQAALMLGNSTASIDSFLLTGDDNIAGIWAARCLSFFIPGVGQMVLGRITKGVAMFVGWAICFGLIVLWQKDVKALLLMFSKNHTGSMNPVVFIPVIGVVGIWLAAMADLSGGSARTVARHTKVDRPKPPVDLPFE